MIQILLRECNSELEVDIYDLRSCFSNLGLGFGLSEVEENRIKHLCS
jgi:hypothetical protein